MWAWPKRPILKKAAANALFIVEWLTGNPSVKMTINICIYMKRVMTHVRGVASGMPCVDREPAAKDIKMEYMN